MEIEKYLTRSIYCTAEAAGYGGSLHPTFAFCCKVHLWLKLANLYGSMAPGQTKAGQIIVGSLRQHRERLLQPYMNIDFS